MSNFLLYLTLKDVQGFVLQTIRSLIIRNQLLFIQENVLDVVKTVRKTDRCAITRLNQVYLPLERS